MCIVMQVTVSVAIAGASGYAGGEVARLVLGHPELSLGALTAHSNVGESVANQQPHLAAHPEIAGRTFVETSAEVLAGHDVVVLGLPHGASGDIAAAVRAASPEVVLVDLGADHRLVDPTQWRAYYGSDHAGTWTYGMPELIHAGETRANQQRSALGETREIAVPGCNVTAITLAIQPGVATGLIDPTDIVAVLAVGYSGAGKAAKTHLLASEGLGAAVAYGVGGGHRHNPEVRQNLAVAGAEQVGLSFTPVLVPMSRGILATVTAPLRDGVTEADLRAAWEMYDDEQFVHVLAPGAQPSTAAALGANTALIALEVDERANRLVVTCAIDNLVKGTAGAAIQSINLALGLPEQSGLASTGVAP